MNFIKVAIEEIKNPNDINCVRLLLDDSNKYVWMVEKVGGGRLQLTEPTSSMFASSPLPVLKKLFGKEYTDKFYFDKYGVFGVNIDNLESLDKKQSGSGIAVKCLMAKFKDGNQYGLTANSEFEIDKIKRGIESRVDSENYA